MAWVVFVRGEGVCEWTMSRMGAFYSRGVGAVAMAPPWISSDEPGWCWPLAGRSGWVVRFWTNAFVLVAVQAVEEDNDCGASRVSGAMSSSESG